MLDKKIYARSVAHAVDLAGGYEPLAARLRADVDDLVDWAHGRSTPETITFLFLLDFIVEETRKVARQTMALGLTEQTVAKARKHSLSR